MAKKLSPADEKLIKTQLNRFKKLASNKEFTLGKPSENGRCVYISE